LKASAAVVKTVAEGAWAAMFAGCESGDWKSGRWRIIKVAFVGDWTFGGEV
jgi:hypothetical protein